MKDVPINNVEILNILDEILWFKNPEVSACARAKEDFLSHRERMISDEYLQLILDKGKDHDGFPEIVGGYSYSIDTGSFVSGADPNTCEKIINNVANITFKLQEELSLRKNALFCYYPPGGYISWHNNANASSYNFIFTWSETGNGYFKYRNGKTGELVTIQDKKGWQCKAGYFGAYADPKEYLCYHCASTECDRITVAFVLNREEMSVGMQNMIIEELSSEI